MSKAKDHGNRISTEIERTKTQDGDYNPSVGEYILITLSMLFIILLMPFSLLYTLKIAKEYERVIILRLGKMVSKKAKGPGVFFVIPCLDELKMVDLRTKACDVKPQEVMLKDSLTITIDAVAFVRVTDPSRAAFMGNIVYSTKLKVATTLRKLLGTKTLPKLLSSRRKLSHEAEKMIAKSTRGWGVKIERIELKNLKLPKDLQRSMAVEAETNRGAKAKLLYAQGEKEASEKLRLAAEIIDQSPASMYLRYLQTMNDISKKRSKAVILPIPEVLINMWHQD